MSKHKSEVLRVKIQFTVKFPQEVITKIRTLPRVFPKMFRTAAWRKTRGGYFWHYVCKTINLCSRKVVFAVFTEISSSSFFKMLLKSKKFSRNRQKILFEEIVHHQIKYQVWTNSHFFYEKIFTYTIYDIWMLQKP